MDNVNEYFFKRIKHVTKNKQLLMIYQCTTEATKVYY